eukprot:TRINITY_DN5257_c0_g1_i1.p1 TRINITY_DN5257_c0_g1~~TRINITY_DN5257_c0_g1_i1.p1  ORF type:complete len:322 (+),score=48.29 TRINITY_DN5257_c0_g1_i1:105-1070(+)
MHVAVIGCAHGELEKIYDSVEHISSRHGLHIDIIVCCGDFQAVRTEEDLRSLNCPQKYKRMNSFVKYFNGEKRAPILTLFVGGNHEASSHAFELPYGGWAAPNIYYLGHANVVRFGGLRIAGISGIFKEYSYRKGRFEKPPFNNKDIVSVYHQREIDVFRLCQTTPNVDILLSHDWPRGITRFGDANRLFRQKKHLMADAQSNALGSRAVELLMYRLRPRFQFAAHLHCKFAAVVPHTEQQGGEGNGVTRFLALDKVLPRKDFLQVLTTLVCVDILSISCVRTTNVFFFFFLRMIESVLWYLFQCETLASDFGTSVYIRGL